MLTLNAFNFRPTWHRQTEHHQPALCDTQQRDAQHAPFAMDLDSSPPVATGLTPRPPNQPPSPVQLPPRVPASPPARVRRDVRLLRSPPKPGKDGERTRLGRPPPGLGSGRTKPWASANSQTRPLLPATERQAENLAGRRTRKASQDEDITPDGGSAGREGRQFAVANVGNNGRIYLR